MAKNVQKVYKQVQETLAAKNEPKFKYGVRLPD
jgi:hypothetical protein